MDFKRMEIECKKFAEKRKYTNYFEFSEEINMDIRCAQIADFDKIVSFYKYVIEKTQAIEKFARWIYGQHPTDAMILNYIEQEAMYLLEEEQTIIGAMAVTMSQSDDYHCIDWSIDALASNEPAHKMYRALGFKYTGKQHLYAENTGWTDFLFFEYTIKV